MSALKLIASNPTPERSEDQSIGALLDRFPHSELVGLCVDCGVLAHGSMPARGELVTALFQLQVNMRLGRRLLKLTGASDDAQQALATLEHWQADAARATELEAELLELERKAEHHKGHAPLEALLAEGQRLFKLSPAMVNRWRGLYETGEASVGSLRKMLDMLEPIPALANGRA